MPSRSRAPVRRSPRTAPQRPDQALAGRAGRAGRPLLVPFAAVFAVLVAVEDLYLAWLLRGPGGALDWYVAVPLSLAAMALVGAVLVILGRGRGWLVLSAAAVVPLFGLLGLAVLFGYLGGGSAMWSALLMLIGPIGCLALSLRRPVREWSSPGRATRRPVGGPRAERAR